MMRKGWMEFMLLYLDDPERAVYNFSGSEDESDGGLRARLDEGGSPGQAGSILPLEVKEPGEASVPSTNRTVEADLNKEGEEIGEASLGTDVINHQYGLQERKDEDYLVMRGGFCTADDERHQESSREPFEIEKEGLALDNNSNIVPEESTGPHTCIVSSNTFEAEFSSAGYLSGVEPTLHAVPFLRRKKRRSAEFSSAGYLSGVEPTLHAVPFLRRKKRRVG